MPKINPTSLTVIILTFNEELHLARCIGSIAPVAERVIVVDSFSTDRTLEIARGLGAEIAQHPFVNQAQQFQWALDHIPVNSEWVMRIDADEYILPELAQELTQALPGIDASVTGLGIKRRVFYGQMDQAGYYPMVLLRIWRNGAAYVEQKWMDEHICLKHGNMQILKHDMVDHNLNNLDWWTAKHNAYATREAVERLNLQHQFNTGRQDASLKQHKAAYLRLPLFIRPFLFFSIAIFLRLGFLEGKPGLIWHLLQGFWFQFLVDAKIFQINYLAKKHNKPVVSVLQEDFGINFQEDAPTQG
ncbi:MAG: glycosyltransferase family 2 protein [Lewinellaceae bacterium]|nr:glycosyltransferase family 2 protein [Lewinellaceae bacterium]